MDEAEAGRRADVFLSDRLPEISRASIQSLMKEGKVQINGRRAKPAQRVARGDLVGVQVDLQPSLTAEPENIPVQVLYHDSDLAVIDKPPGLVVHPAPGHAGGTLANALTARFRSVVGVGSPLRPGIVHRLDKDTSGLMVVALNPAAQKSLQQQIASRSAGRVYLALASGQVQPPRGTIDAPIGRDVRNRQRMAVHGAAARSAATSYHALEYFPGLTYLEVKLHTGRTHQIRAHFAALGHPLAGDRTYGGPTLHGLSRQFLHAHRLSLDSPSTGRRLEFQSPLPRDLERVLENVRSS